MSVKRLSLGRLIMSVKRLRLYLLLYILAGIDWAKYLIFFTTQYNISLRLIETFRLWEENVTSTRFSQ